MRHVDRLRKAEERAEGAEGELSEARTQRVHYQNIVDNAHQVCDRAGLRGLPGGGRVGLVERIKMLAKHAEKAKERADKVEHVLRLSGDMREFEALIESSAAAEKERDEALARLSDISECCGVPDSANCLECSTVVVHGSKLQRRAEAAERERNEARKAIKNAHDKMDKRYGPMLKRLADGDYATKAEVAQVEEKLKELAGIVLQRFGGTHLNSKGLLALRELAGEEPIRDDVPSAEAEELERLRKDLEAKMKHRDALAKAVESGLITLSLEELQRVDQEIELAQDAYERCPGAGCEEASDDASE